MADEEINPEENSGESPEESSTETEDALKEDLEQVAEAAEEVTQAAGDTLSEHPNANRTIDFIKEVPLAVTIEVGRSRMTIQDLLQLGQGSVVELSKLAGDPLDVYVNGYCVARGEAVIVNEKFGLRVVEIVDPKDRIQALG